MDMTQLLEKAFNKLSSLPDEEQDSFASFIMSQLESEAKWDGLFSNSQDILAHLASEAIAEDDAGMTQEMTFDCELSKNKKI